MKTLLEVLISSTEYLTKKGVLHPRRSAEKILQHALQLNKTDLYLQFDRPLSDKELDLLRPLLRRRGEREPIDYILQNISFCDLSLTITKDVLIPRQETELLAEKVTAILKNEGSMEGKRLWDICTGSGALGLSLKKRFPSLGVILSDISAEALAIASKNAEDNQLDVSIVQGDFIKPLQGEVVDYIVCNPPYISEEEYMQLSKEVRDFEPEVALKGGEDGLDFYRLLAGNISSILAPEGKCFLEIGYQQGALVRKIFEGFAGRIEQDWSGLDRFFFLEKE